jgi:hypothetical protein
MSGVCWYYVGWKEILPARKRTRGAGGPSLSLGGIRPGGMTVIVIDLLG